MSNGYILYTGPSLLDPSSDITVIVTGTSKASDNPKTGAMLQTWILSSDIHPVEAVKKGEDKAICGDCPLRTDDDGKRGCYVQVFAAPSNVWKKAQGGGYPFLDPSSYADVFLNKSVRIGSYGDPAALPNDFWTPIVMLAKNHTAYTHQWRKADQRMRSWCMASTETMEDTQKAHDAGWRTFRMGTTIQPSEVLCPASVEAGMRTTCEKCHLCNGMNTDLDKRKSIMIFPHGAQKKTALKLTL